MCGTANVHCFTLTKSLAIHEDLLASARSKGEVILSWDTSSIDPLRYELGFLGQLQGGG